jgi:hypothetical protein
MGQGFSAMPSKPEAQLVGMSVSGGVTESGRRALSASPLNEAMVRKEEFAFSTGRAAKVAKPAKVGV